MGTELDKFLKDNPQLRAEVPGAKTHIPFEEGDGGKDEGEDDEFQLPEIVEPPVGNTTAEKVQNEAEKYCVDAIRTLANVMHDTVDLNKTGKTRSIAALGILDRSLGRPRQTIFTSRTKGEEPDFSNLTDEELDQYEALLKKATAKNVTQPTPATGQS